MKGTPDFPQCGFSAQTVAALRAVGAQFKHVNIFEEPELREALKRYSNWPTYPQLYVKGELVGGCDIALEMYRSGELKKLLRRTAAPSARLSACALGAALGRSRFASSAAVPASPPAQRTRPLLGRRIAVAHAVADKTEDVRACARRRRPPSALSSRPTDARRPPPPWRAPSARAPRRPASRCQSTRRDGRDCASRPRAPGRVQEAQIEGRVVADQDRAPAVVGAHCVAHFAEDALHALRARAAPGATDDRDRCR